MLADLRWMRSFVTVARVGHFGRAAQELSLTQSAVSTHVASLERHLGVILLLRRPRELVLNEEGRAYLQRAQDVLERAEAAERIARRYSDHEAGDVVIAYNAGFTGRMLRTLIGAGLTALPEARMHVSGSFTNRVVLDLVRRGAADIGLIAGDAVGADLRARRLGTVRLQALLPSGGEYAEGISASEIAAHRLVLPAAADGLTLRSVVLDFLESAGCSPREIREANDGATVTTMVSAGVGVGFGTTGADPLMGERIATIDIIDAPELPVSLVRSREIPSALVRRVSELALA